MIRNGILAVMGNENNNIDNNHESIKCRNYKNIVIKNIRNEQYWCCDRLLFCLDLVVYTYTFARESANYRFRSVLFRSDLSSIRCASADVQLPFSPTFRYIDVSNMCVCECVRRIFFASFSFCKYLR